MTSWKPSRLGTVAGPTGHRQIPPMLMGAPAQQLFHSPIPQLPGAKAAVPPKDTHLTPHQHGPKHDLESIEEVVADDDHGGTPRGPALAGADGLDAGRGCSQETEGQRSEPNPGLAIIHIQALCTLPSLPPTYSGPPDTSMWACSQQTSQHFRKQRTWHGILY